METNLVHAEGDYFGQPFRLRTWQRGAVYQMYELNPDGSRLVKQALLELPKGNGKTELAAAISCAELGGPVVFDKWDPSGRPVGRRRVSPDIPVAAASFEQADKVFGAARTMIKHGPLAEFFDVFDVEILLKGGPGRMYRVAAVAGTNDGGLPTFFCADELHEWLGKKARVHVVLANGIAKRRDGWSLNITTAGWDPASLLGRMHARGKRIQAGKEKPDPAFLFICYDYTEGKDKAGNKQLLDFANTKALAAAIRQANPASDDFLSVEERLTRSTQIDEHEFRRYYLNQWVNAPDSWLDEGVWDACADAGRAAPEDGAEIVVMLDGQFNGHSTAIVGATVEKTPHVFVIRAWEKDPVLPALEAAESPEDVDDEDDVTADWRVTIPQVEQALRDVCERFTVRTIGMDPNRWRSTLARLQEEQLPVVAYETRSPARMVPACAQFKDALVDKGLTHDANASMAAHLANAMLKVDGRGPRIVKEHDKSARHIDLAIGAIGAFDLAVRANAGGDDDWRPQ